ncbi:hypothetical protein BDN72DRAFT_525966 [Pluteus cervinus]|uniref:Uncharacterized protein n=1 Tax=Pluteus cervinus TaxID=181527 RepID=A0ACD3A547_9AGAR|nr:hypothetical protein BDN72DRAFT_525966 [Pluteus cervinus]
MDFHGEKTEASVGCIFSMLKHHVGFLQCINWIFCTSVRICMKSNPAPRSSCPLLYHHHHDVRERPQHHPTTLYPDFRLYRPQYQSSKRSSHQSKLHSAAGGRHQEAEGAYMREISMDVDV